VKQSSRMVEISPVELLTAARKLPSTQILLNYGDDLLTRHAALWLGLSNRRPALRLPAGTNREHLLIAMRNTARAYALPFDAERWVEPWNGPTGVYMNCEREAIARLPAHGAWEQVVLRAGDDIDAAVPAHAGAVHLLELPALIAPTSTRQDLRGGRFFTQEQWELAERLGIVPIDQVLHFLFWLLEHEQNRASTGALTHTLAPTHRIDPVRLSTLSGRPVMERPALGSATTSSAYTSPMGIRSDDLEVSIAWQQKYARDVGGRPSGHPVFEFRFMHCEDGMPLAVYDTGGTSTRLLICCNAFGMPAQLFEPLASELTPEYRVVTWQSRDVPAVFPSERGPTVEQQVADLHAVVRGFKAERCVLLGFGLGAQVALEFASRFGEFIDALMLLHGVFAYEEAPQTAWQRDLVKRMTYLASDRQVAERSCYALYGGASPGPQNVYVGSTPRNDMLLGRMTSQPVRSPDSLHRYAQLVVRSVHREQYVHWHRIGPNTVFVAGLRDEVASSQAVIDASRRVEGAQLVQWSDADHYSHYFEPERVAELIRRAASSNRDA